MNMGRLRSLTWLRAICWMFVQVGIKRPEAIAIPSVRNDAAFIATVFSKCCPYFRVG